MHVSILFLITASSVIGVEFVEDGKCPMLADGPLLEVAEKICEFCHEITSHEKPNMRSECRVSMNVCIRDSFLS
ncbi:unnamed protein product [Heligmosomoides polygyrus]|uniref:Saposin B-type domain-containing protein n=1 Tax=Heligmosomoides polygyrus TaxID=6339 RepID=A0A183FS55_HELPZ|nr:unnamed protein product [Heligmosomoides polygyrus]